MTARATLAAADVRALVVSYRDALRTHQQVINRLNVYPVPDGDTGTNMALTLDAVVDELDGLGPDASMGEVCKAVAHGSLMGARGNSGVILSQLLRGMAERLGPAEEAGPPDLAEAMVIAGTLARQAVVRPVEGTILTVARAGGEGATAGLEEGGTLVVVAERARAAAAEALARTPELLEVLARAGVVDAGGSGYLLVLRRPADASSTGGHSPRRPGSTRSPRTSVPSRAAAARARATSRRGTSATRSCTSSTPPTTRSRTSRRSGPASATRSSWWAATGCGTATSTPTTSGRRWRPPSTPAGPATSG